VSPPRAGDVAFSSNIFNFLIEIYYVAILPSTDRPFNMVSPTKLNLPGIEEDLPDEITPRPLNKLFGSTDMSPPPMIQLVPLVLNSIWDSDMMTKYTDDVTGQKKWHCGHCRQEWFEHNATKALGHVVGIVKDVKACRGTISPCNKGAYLNFYHSKYDTKAFKPQSFAKLNSSLETTDQRTMASLVKELRNVQQIPLQWI
jgi:predicted nucleic-acid-binding Zn-ribbon protein